MSTIENINEASSFLQEMINRARGNTGPVTLGLVLILVGLILRFFQKMGKWKDEVWRRYPCSVLITGIAFVLVSLVVGVGFGLGFHGGAGFSEQPAAEAGNLAETGQEEDAANVSTRLDASEAGGIVHILVNGPEVFAEGQPFEDSDHLNLYFRQLGDTVMQVRIEDQFADDQVMTWVENAIPPSVQIERQRIKVMEQLSSQ